ncbi:uncharacterized protein M421DRAFT_283116 [Didymella exigua CBS 183.55]|uniref:Uncharacterized protein n=1 Tax=Didymella exigua CBS 183.55 TaxID=1150837 RepID=A0A6A5RXT5_9PLEO|nr:uncharacterized protein M421DRAFT_283116 [Didymella exigua CBS 183.55]KAF1932034.1 hypothetical protein M421DRAFT_283116 [Didymella exigua CBS 183.55]
MSASLGSVFSLILCSQPWRIPLESLRTKCSCRQCLFIFSKNSEMSHSGCQTSCIHSGQPSSSSYPSFPLSALTSSSPSPPVVHSTSNSSSSGLSFLSSCMSSSTKPPRSPSS